jgi:hypothetical protein
MLARWLIPDDDPNGFIRMLCYEAGFSKICAKKHIKIGRVKIKRARSLNQAPRSLTIIDIRLPK